MTSRRLYTLVLAVALLWPLSALGDLPWDVSSETVGQTSIPREIVDLFDEHFVLSEDQRLVAEEFHRLHIENFTRYIEAVVRPAVRRHHEAIRKIEGLAEQLPARIEAEIELGPMADRQNELDETFLEELRTLLTETQDEAWDGFIQRLNRLRYLRRGARYSNESVDLLDLLERIELEPDEIVDAEAFGDLRTTYARQMDAALMRRVRITVGLARTHFRNRRDQNEASRIVEYVDEEGRLITVRSNPEAIEAYFRRITELADAHKRQRDINRRFKVLFVQHLTGDAVLRFTEHHDAAVLGRWWNKENGKAYSFSIQLLEAELLSIDQQRAIEAIAEQVESRRKQISQRLVMLSDDLMDANWERFDPEKSMRLREESESLHKDRILLDNRALEQIWALLTPEQQALVEKPRPWDLDFVLR